MSTLIHSIQSIGMVLHHTINSLCSNSIILCTATVILSIYLFNLRRRRSSKLVPYAPFGVWETMKTLTTSETPLRSYILKVTSSSNQWNFKLPVPYLNIFIIGDPQLQREILTDPTTHKSTSFYTGFRQVFQGTCPLFTRLHYDSYVKSMRKSTAHAFSGNQVRRMMVIAKEELKKWLEKDIQELIDGKNDGLFDPCVEINRVTFCVICKAAFEYECTLEEYNEFTQYLEPALREYLLKQVLNPLRKSLGAFIPDVHKASEGAKGAMAFAQRVLESYRKLGENKTCGTKSLASILESNTSIPTNIDRYGEVLLWLVAGHDTTGYSVASTMILLAKYKRVQNRLREELEKARKEGNPTKSMHINCPYLEYVWKESNRYMPVSPTPSVRAAGKDFYVKDSLDGKQKIIPKGSTVLISSIISNQNKTVFGDDSDVFRPERWEDAANNDPERYKLMNQSLLTFSIGNRSCPGQSLAMAEVYTFLPEFFLNHKVEVVDEGRPDYFLTLKYKGAKLRVSKA